MSASQNSENAETRSVRSRRGADRGGDGSSPRDFPAATRRRDEAVPAPFMYRFIGMQFVRGPICFSIEGALKL